MDLLYTVLPYSLFMVIFIVGVLFLYSVYRCHFSSPREDTEIVMPLLEQLCFSLSSTLCYPNKGNLPTVLIHTNPYTTILFLVDSISSYFIVYMILKMDFAFIVFLTFIAWIIVFTVLGLCIQMLLKTLKEKHFQSSEKSWKEWKSFCHLSVDNDGYSPVLPQPELRRSSLQEHTGNDLL